MSNYKAITVQENNKIVLVTINRPHALNALNNDVFEDLIRLFNDDLDPRKINGVIITGAGEKAFVAGADIKEFLSLDAQKARELSKRGHDIFAVIENFPVVVVAAVNGFALGGGCELAMACHLRVAHANARFGQPEVNLGILPGYGGTQRLVHLIGKGRAMEMIMTGDMIDGTTAHTFGLVNILCEAGAEVATATKLIEKIAKKAPLAIAETIKAVNAHFRHGKDGYQTEIDSFGKLAATEDFREGATAFIEKRKPGWKGL